MDAKSVQHDKIRESVFPHFCFTLFSVFALCSPFALCFDFSTVAEAVVVPRLVLSLHGQHLPFINGIFHTYATTERVFWISHPRQLRPGHKE